MDEGTLANLPAVFEGLRKRGLPIVAPDANGRIVHVKTGAPNAAFMTGLWGPHGGPGTIWKIDGATARASLFANVMTANRPNSGAALGGLAFDPQSKSLFVADRETGLIHRLAMDGADLGSYDHGVAGRAAQGLPAVPWNAQQPIDVISPQFDSGDPSTWNFAAPERRVFGLAVHGGRLYYAVADGLQIWSVGVQPDGSFADDAVIELAAPPAAGPTEIAKITFDDQGRMLLAERPAPTGAFDFEALSEPAIGRVLRYAIVGTAGGRRVWQEKPDEYALGFPHDYRNGNGGVEVGYNYDRSGDVIAGSCGGFVWMSGEDLRETTDATLAARLSQSGPLPVSGLQGVGAWQDRPRNTPPIKSYFISYADGPPDEAARGHMGDIAIPRVCEPPTHAGLEVPAPPSGYAPPPGGPPLPPGPIVPPGRPGPPPRVPPTGHNPPPPPGSCLPDQVRRVPTGGCAPSCPRPDVQIGRRCCAVATLATGGECSNSTCPAGQTAIGPSNYCCDASHVYAGPGGAPACCSGPLVNGQCQPPKPPQCPSGGAATAECPCPNGYVQTGGTCCLASKVTSTGVCCPAGQAPSGANKNECLPILRIPIGPLCCASGLIPTSSGACCAPANVTTTGVCCSQPVNPSNRAECPAPIQSIPVCAPGYAKMPDGTCCSRRLVSADGRSCLASRPSCGPGEFRNPQGTCERLAPPVVAPPACPAGEALTREGVARPSRPSPARPASPDTGPDLVPPFRRTARAGKREPPTAPAHPSRRPRARLAKSDCAMASAHPWPRRPVRLAKSDCATASARPSRRRLARRERRATSEASARRSLPRRARPDCCATRAEFAFRRRARGARSATGWASASRSAHPVHSPRGPGEFGPPRGPGFPRPGGPGFGPGGGAFRQQLHSSQEDSRCDS